jgi:GT2 family glycosyltransferase
MIPNSILVVLTTLGERVDTLRETLRSIDAQRSEVSLSLVVVLPSGAAQARELAEFYGAVIVLDANRGISNAINLGINAATDETYYAWIGDDDLFRPNGLKRLLALMRSNPSAVLSYGGCDYIDAEGEQLFKSRAGKLARWLLPWGPDLIPHPGSLVRLDAMRAVGLFDTELKYAMDLDLFLKLRKLGPFVSTKQPVSAFRWHAESLTVANRSRSTAEARKVKNRHLPPLLRPLSPAWEIPVKWAAEYAAWSINRRTASLPLRPRVSEIND